MNKAELQTPLRCRLWSPAAGVAIGGGACLAWPRTSMIVLSASSVIGPPPGPAPGPRLVELAGMAEDERAQEVPHRGRRQDLVAKHRAGRAAAQRVQVVDAVTAGQDAVDDGEDLGARVDGAGPDQADQLVGGLGDPEPVGQDGGQQQPRAGDRMVIVERDFEVVKVLSGADAGIERCLYGLRLRTSDTNIPVAQRPFHVRITPPRAPHRWTVAER